MHNFTEEDTPAQIVKMFPKASDLFKVNQIDFCCGGDKPLRQTFVDNSDLDSSVVMDELNIAYTNWKSENHSVTNWDEISSTDLIDHIKQKHHLYLMEELPALGEFVSKISRVHGSKHPHLLELHRLYNDFQAEMEEHTIKEDNEVFPLIKKYEENPSEELLKEIRIANGDLVEEHEVAGNILKQMRVITNGFTPPEDACGSYRITYDRLAEMEDNTFQHVHLENNILFKRI